MKSATAHLKPILLTIGFLLTFGTTVSAQQTTSNDGKMPQIKSASTVSEEDKKNFYQLTKSASKAFVAGEKEKAKEYAETLLKQAETFKDDWNYGNAIHVANIVLGHLALEAGDMAEAKRFLLEAGKTPGSPQLNSFGPNMRLAKALLERGEKETVIEYFDLCDKFWERRFSRLAEWKAAVEKGEMPKFGANLLYQFPDSEIQKQTEF
jgi:hypothetical protein